MPSDLLDRHLVKLTSTAVKSATEKTPARSELIKLLNEDLAREYQAVISYIVYSQAIKGPEYTAIAKEMEKHAGEELAHAVTIARQIDYLGGEITTEPEAVKTSENAKEMLEFAMDAENEAVRRYRERVRQCEDMGEFAVASQFRNILVTEQEHQIDLAAVLGKDVAEIFQD